MIYKGFYSFLYYMVKRKNMFADRFNDICEYVAAGAIIGYDGGRREGCFKGLFALGAVYIVGLTAGIVGKGVGEMEGTVPEVMEKAIVVTPTILSSTSKEGVRISWYSLPAHVAYWAGVGTPHLGRITPIIQESLEKLF